MDRTDVMDILVASMRVLLNAPTDAIPQDIEPQRQIDGTKLSIFSVMKSTARTTIMRFERRERRIGTQA